VSLPGRTLLHCRVLETRAGWAHSYRALDTKVDRPVAIKVLPGEFVTDAESIARLRREARLLAALSHPNIAAIYDLEECEGIWFLVLEFVPGKTLADPVGTVAA
jgi:serine/threonine-protein kinase